MHVKISLQGKTIPRSEAGDPAFVTLTEVTQQFTGDEIVELVNRALYYHEYQKHHHRKRAQAERERLGPIKKKVRQMFGVSWLKATDEQVRRATEEVQREGGKATAP